MTDSIVLQWRSDPEAESVLSFIDVPWIVDDILLSDVDWNESAHNGARMKDAINEEKIEEYEMAMRTGDVFPRIVVEHGKSGYAILGGNQRINAVKRLGVLTIGAYCVRDITTAQRESLIRSLNARHGWGTDKTERIEHAVFLIRAHGLSVSDASRLMMVGTTSVTRRIRAEDVRRSLAKRGIDSNKMSLSQLEAISRVPEESLAEDLGRIVEKFAPTFDQTANVVKAINASRSRAGQAKCIKDFSKELSEAVPVGDKGRNRIRTPRRDKFIGLMERLSQFLERGNDGTGFSSLDELQCSEIVDGDRIKVLATKIMLRLSLIAKVKQ